MQINKGKAKRVYVDSIVANQLTMADFIKLTNEGYTLVTTNTVCDIKPFQDKVDAFREMVEAGVLVIERWLEPNQMTKKNFYWSSCGIETMPNQTFANAISILPNKNQIMALVGIMQVYGLAKGEWPQGEWSPPAPMDAEMAEILGLHIDATRTEVLSAAKAIGRKDLFDRFNLSYSRGIALQHKCKYLLNSDGSVTKL